jgi:hypothetical protein
MMNLGLKRAGYSWLTNSRPNLKFLLLKVIGNAREFIGGMGVLTGHDSRARINIFPIIGRMHIYLTGIVKSHAVPPSGAGPIISGVSVKSPTAVGVPYPCSVTV